MFFLKVNLNWCGRVLSTYTFTMWNVSMYSIFALAEPFDILSFRCHCIIKIPEHAPEIFRSSCSWHSVLVLLHTSQTHVFRNPRQYLVEQNQCDAKQVLARPAFSLWRQNNVHVMEQWSTLRCCTTRHFTWNFRTRYNQIMWFLFFSYIIRFSLFFGIAYIIWLILHIARLYYWVKSYY